MRLCKDCRHILPWRGEHYSDLSRCLSLDVNKDNANFMVNATAGMYCNWARGATGKRDGVCGIDGKYFEPKHETTPAPSQACWLLRAKRYLKERYGQ